MNATNPRLLEGWAFHWNHGAEEHFFSKTANGWFESACKRFSVFRPPFTGFEPEPVAPCDACSKGLARAKGGRA